jgi:hypothetical protein
MTSIMVRQSKFNFHSETSSNVFRPAIEPSGSALFTQEIDKNSLLRARRLLLFAAVMTLVFAIGEFVGNFERTNQTLSMYYKWTYRSRICVQSVFVCQLYIIPGDILAIAVPCILTPMCWQTDKSIG